MLQRKQCPLAFDSLYLPFPGVRSHLTGKKVIDNLILYMEVFQTPTCLYSFEGTEYLLFKEYPKDSNV